MDWESQDDGFIAKLLVEDGAKDLAVGDPVLVFVEDQVRKTLSSPAQYQHHLLCGHEWPLVNVMATAESWRGGLLCLCR